LLGLSPSRLPPYKFSLCRLHSGRGRTPLSKYQQITNPQKNYYSSIIVFSRPANSATNPTSFFSLISPYSGVSLNTIYFKKWLFNPYDQQQCFFDLLFSRQHQNLLHIFDDSFDDSCVGLGMWEKGGRFGVQPPFPQESKMLIKFIL
jgi:hypothetical protein